jgi:deferrochelatase/peroxidase EfeB
MPRNCQEKTGGRKEQAGINRGKNEREREREYAKNAKGTQRMTARLDCLEK